jgi:hypothetical protein
MPAMSGTSGEHSDVDEEVATAQALSANRAQKQRHDKRNLCHGGPLKLGLPSSTPPRLKSSNSSHAEEKLLQQCQDIYAKLPKRSRYAQHKLKCLSKAMELLRRGRCGCAHAVHCAPVSWLLPILLVASCNTATPRPSWRTQCHSRQSGLRIYLRNTVSYGTSADPKQLLQATQCGHACRTTLQRPNAAHAAGLHAPRRRQTSCKACSAA